MRSTWATLALIGAIFQTERGVYGLETTESLAGRIPTVADVLVTDTAPMYGSKAAGAVTQMPASLSELLQNLHAAWDNKLLVQDGFWSSKELLTFFNAKKVTLERQLSQSDKDGTLAVHSNLLLRPVIARRNHYKTPEETASWVYHYPSHVEQTGWITVELDMAPAVTWSDVTSIFGPGSVNRGPLPPPISDTRQSDQKAFPQPVSLWEEQTTLITCYESPPLLRDKMAEWEIDSACFYLKRLHPSNPSGPTAWSHLWDPQDDDLVLRIAIAEHLNHIFMFCYALNLDPALLDKCPPRIQNQHHHPGKCTLSDTRRLHHGSHCFSPRC